MAETTLPRSGLPQWSADADLWPGRTGFNTILSNISAGFAIWAQGTTAARPAAAYAGRYYWATDTQRLWYDNGTAWTEISPVGGGGTPQGMTVGASGAEGTSRIAARADHVHALTAPSTDPGAIAYGGTGGRGASSTVARSDHSHTLPALPLGVTPPGLVEADGTAGVAGVSTSVARADHTHALDAVVGTYTPTITTVGSGAAAPSVGGGTATGRYLLLGKLCWVFAHLFFGSGMSGGSGDVRIALPFPTPNAGEFEQHISMKLWQPTIGVTMHGQAIMNSNTALMVPMFPKQDTQTSTVPLRNTVAGSADPNLASPQLGGVHPLVQGSRLAAEGWYLIA